MYSYKGTPKPQVSPTRSTSMRMTERTPGDVVENTPRSALNSGSGGSITSGLLALKWKRLSFDPARVRADFVPEVVAPIRRLADETIDAESVSSASSCPAA